MVHNFMKTCINALENVTKSISVSSAWLTDILAHITKMKLINV
uniref:Uncharacterized protein n=1 Tax=Rhizophora mucronata TaxID=61149 RepID=A0A2P2R0K6_RHIMU